MDFLQIALIVLIIFVTLLLTLLGIQVFFILKDIKHSVSLLERFLESVGGGNLHSSEQAAEARRIIDAAAKEAKQAMNQRAAHHFFRRGG